VSCAQFGQQSAGSNRYCLHIIDFLVAFSRRERISERQVARQPKFDPQHPRQSPRFLSQPSHAPLTNTPTDAFHLQPCQTYKGSSPLLGVPNLECHQPSQINVNAVKMLTGRSREARWVFKCEIWVSRSGVAEDSRLQKFDVVSIDKQ
jgi:hypothetical protein